MKYVCLGYLDEDAWSGRSDEDRRHFMHACFAYDDELRDGGNYVAGNTLQPSANAMTLRPNGARVAITDGPFAETKEQLGGIIELEATDLNHAIRLISKHPSFGMGATWEIRPANRELKELFERKDDPQEEKTT
jgi:hypothetical protein